MKSQLILVLLASSFVWTNQSLHAENTEQLEPAAKPAEVEENLQNGSPKAGVMTPDLLLINPAQAGPEGSKPQAPLSSLVGNTLKMDVNRKDLVLDGMHGLSVSITNDTDRPIVIDCSAAKAQLKTKSLTSADIFVVQKAVQPKTNLGDNLLAIPTKAVPAFFTIGAIPTIHDIFVEHGPMLKRYGTDEKRRQVELGRFGMRILWPNQETAGIVYFKTHHRLANATIELPVHTLFNLEDAALVSQGPAGSTPAQ